MCKYLDGNLLHDNYKTNNILLHEIKQNIIVGGNNSNNNNSNNNNYKNKYIKYKTKYLELKNKLLNR